MRAFVGIFAVLLSSPAFALGVSSVKLSREGVILTEADRSGLVNKARCDCNESIEVSIAFSDRTGTGETAIVAGTRCIDTDGRIDDSCTVLWRSGVEDLAAIEEMSLSVVDLAGGDCSGSSSTENLEILVDPNDDDEWTSLYTVSFGIDTERPAAPTGDQVLAGETLAEVVFSANEDAETNTRYQVLCRSGTEPIRTSPPEAGFESAADLCGGDGPAARFVCAEVANDSSSVTITGLENGTSYVFEVVAIDAADNPSEAVVVGEAIPAPEEDLWERYQRSGGTADGEACFVATAAYGDYSHSTVRWLRVFRDTVLLPTAGGRALVDTYYDNSPAAARRIEDSPVLAAAARAVLKRLEWFAISTLTNGDAR